MSLGPAALIRTIPGALGRTPADELVLVGISTRNADAAVLITVPLWLNGPDGEEPPALDALAAAREAVTTLARDGADQLIAVVYADEVGIPSTAARWAATALVSAEHANLYPLDALAVSRGRWFSYECSDPSCCPPEGTPILEGLPTP